MSCESCQLSKAVMIRSISKQKICKACFCEQIESEIHNVIVKENIFSKGENVAVGMSGGKDSTVLAHILNLLNKKYEYGINIFLLSIDEGIKNYRDHSLETVNENQKNLNLPLKIISYKDHYMTMDEIVKRVNKSNCTYCGVFRRKLLDFGANELNLTQVVTGHNADDMAETVLLNLLRGDINRLKSCTRIKSNGKIARSKPFKYTFEKEIVTYAFYRNLKYFSTECTYSPGAYRGHARLFVKELERINPQLVMNIIKTGEMYEQHVNIEIFPCIKCQGQTSKNNTLCTACSLYEKLLDIEPQI